MSVTESVLTSEPRYVLTADQDWAPEWACELFIDLIKQLELPFHVFRTNLSVALDFAAQEGIISNGWHPNFRTESTHGSTPGEVIASMTSMFPGCNSARAHTYYESSETWQLLKQAGISYESHGPTDMEDGLRPLRMMSGLTRFPVFLEDDVHLMSDRRDDSLRRLHETVHTPGLKVLDFHPIHLGLNTPSIGYYDENRGTSRNKKIQHNGVGVRDAFLQVVQTVRAGGFDFLSFESLT